MTDPAPRPWPPREGKAFFLLWMAGAVAQSFVSRLVVIASQMGSPAGPSIHVKVLFVITVIALAIWQASLLFPRGWRFLLWALVPVLVWATYFFSAGMSPRLVANCFQAASFAGVFVRFPLLIGVRRYPWLYLFPGIVESLLPVVMNFSIRFASPLIAKIVALLPFAGASPIYNALYSGAWLLVGAATAAVLAWWMPPVRSER